MSMKNILMIGTGGTIASEMTPSGLTPELNTEQLLSFIPGIADLCHVDCLQLYSLDSTNICPRHWLGLAAAAGVAFCMQNECLKRRQIPGTCRLLPPIRTLEASMKRLVLVAFLLLLAGEWLGWQRHLPINGAKTSIVILLTLGYSILLWFIYRRGMPGRALAYCCVALFIASMSIFLVS